MQPKYSIAKWKAAKKAFKKCRKIDRKRLKDGLVERIKNGVYRA